MFNFLDSKIMVFFNMFYIVIIFLQKKGTFNVPLKNNISYSALVFLLSELVYLLNS